MLERDADDLKRELEALIRKKNGKQTVVEKKKKQVDKAREKHRKEATLAIEKQHKQNLDIYLKHIREMWQRFGYQWVQRKGQGPGRTAYCKFVWRFKNPYEADEMDKELWEDMECYEEGIQGMEEDLGRRGIADITGNGDSNGDADAIMEEESPDV
ncbi:hypothetical protein GcM3_187008 [Golovinomyces cichoracearum]|uniref:Uncharacterized protein n=1 Tax=Golovinomyces cichoracearum TaxID=62708 RepID=A0A420HJ94_9PEZI|nr:hypothetical protein GcM3_187008 [Golovinomyces cichoracearum]